MAETRGVFTLKTVRNNILNGTYIDPDESFIDQEFSHNTGYHIAGAAPAGSYSHVQKLDYATETSTVLASKIADTPSSTAAVGNGEAAYQAGGYGTTAPAGNRSWVNKVTYATDVVARIPGLLGPQRYGMGSVGNIGFGFFCGGYNTGNLATSDKLTFATDLLAGIPGANISPARRVLTGASNQEYGFLFGGYDSNYSAAVDKIQFNTDTRTAAPSLGTATADASAVGNSTKAFITGGNFAGSLITTQTYELTFSTGTTSTAPGSNLPVARNSMTACGSEENAFFMGGPSSTPVSNIVKINYTTGTVTTISGGLVDPASSAGGASSQQSGQLNGAKKRNIKGKQGQPRGTYLNGFAATEGYGTGYFVGGPPAGYTVMDRITYATDTTVAVPSAYTKRDKQAPGKASTPEHANWIGSVSDTTVERTSYSVDCTFEVPSAAIPQTSGYGAGLQNSTAGYMCGGQGPGGPYLSSIQKLTWATDTGSQAPTRLTRTRLFPAGMGNKNIGFLSGSESPDSSVDRLVYATETVNLSPFAFDPVPRAYVGGASNATDGVVQGGGSPGTSQCRRLNFATESFGLIPSSQALATSPGGGGSGATGNTQNAYSVGGYDGAYRTYCDKLNYSTLTNFLVPSAQGTTPRRYVTGCSSQDQDLPTKPLATITRNRSMISNVPNTGYHGGYTGPQNSTVAKIDFTTDTLSEPTNLTESRSYGGGNSSATAAYFGGGSLSGPINKSTMDKLTYSTDTVAAVSGAALSQARYLFGGQVAGDSTKALWAGGYTTPSAPKSTTDKLVFSSDTTAQVPGAALSASKYGITANASPTAGYVAGGSTGGGNRRTDIDKINMTDETVTRTPSADLPGPRTYAMGMSNPGAGYFVGGSTPSAISETMKLNFASDTVERVSNYPVNVYAAFGTGNKSAAYMTGGATPSYTTATQRLDYSTETYSQTGAFLPSGRGWGASASAQSQGGRYDSNVI